MTGEMRIEIVDLSEENLRDVPESRMAMSPHSSTPTGWQQCCGGALASGRWRTGLWLIWAAGSDLMQPITS